MVHIAEHKRRLVNIAKPLFWLFAMFYFCYHLVSGDKGALAMIQLQQRIESSEIELARVSQERHLLEDKVSRLSANNLDLDLLDEQARRILGYAQKDEIVYYEPRR